MSPSDHAHTTRIHPQQRRLRPMRLRRCNVPHPRRRPIWTLLSRRLPHRRPPTLDLPRPLQEACRPSPRAPRPAPATPRFPPAAPKGRTRKTRHSQARHTHLATDDPCLWVGPARLRDPRLARPWHLPLRQDHPAHHGPESSRSHIPQATPDLGSTHPLTKSAILAKRPSC